MNYPVSEKKCARCSACQLVTKDISGVPLGKKGNVLSVHRNGRMYLRRTGGRVMERVYYSINESSAKTAHQMMSFSDYKEGSSDKMMEARLGLEEEVGG